MRILEQLGEAVDLILERVGKDLRVATPLAAGKPNHLLNALYDRAKRAGLVYTPVDGDQPSLLMNLIDWCRALSLTIAAAGKSSEYDFVFDASRETVRWTDRTVLVPGFERLWTISGDGVAEILEARSVALRAGAPGHEQRCAQHCGGRWQRPRHFEGAVCQRVRLRERGPSGTPARCCLWLRCGLHGGKGGHRARRSLRNVLEALRPLASAPALTL